MAIVRNRIVKVRYSDDQWTVAGKSKRKQFDTKADAVAYAKAIARMSKARVVIYNIEGHVAQVVSYTPKHQPMTARLKLKSSIDREKLRNAIYETMIEREEREREAV